MSAIQTIHVLNGPMAGLWFRDRADLDRFVEQLRPSVTLSSVALDPFGVALKVATAAQWRTLRMLASQDGGGMTIHDHGASDPHHPTVRRIVGPTIALRSGAYFDFLDPDSCDFTIEDVAWGLSNICRFTGQTRFYSVCQHSVHVSEQVPGAYAFEALMHDAAEFVLGDMSKPLKMICPDYVALEKRVEPAILARFGLPHPMSGVVKEADIRMLATEQAQLWDGAVSRDRWASTVMGREPFEMIIPHWPPDVARCLFLDRFQELGGYERMRPGKDAREARRA